MRRRGVRPRENPAAENSVVSNRGLGQGVDGHVGKVDGHRWHFRVLADSSRQVPGVSEQAQSRERQTLADRAATHRRIDRPGQVDARHRSAGGLDSSVPPCGGLPLDGTTGRVHGRPVGLAVHEQQRPELHCDAYVAQDVERAPSLARQGSRPVGCIQPDHGGGEEVQALDEDGVRLRCHGPSLQYPGRRRRIPFRDPLAD